jgi:hypothetical protein
MEQMMACLLAEIRTNQERMEAKLGAEIKTIQEKMGNIQGEMKSQMGSLASQIEANQKEMIVKVVAWIDGMDASQEKSDTIVEHQEVPNKEATVESIGALVDQYGDLHLAIGWHQQPKEWTQCNGGTRQNLATA